MVRGCLHGACPFTRCRPWAGALTDVLVVVLVLVAVVIVVLHVLVVVLVVVLALVVVLVVGCADPRSQLPRSGRASAGAGCVERR